MIKFITFSVFIFTFISGLNSQKFDSIQITIYYDAAGNSSAEFLINQVLPAYPIISDRIILTLVPFCLADMQPGSLNYRANVVHVCAFSQSTDQKTHLDFATCLMSAGSDIIDANIQKCADKSNLAYDAIIECASGEEGRQKLANDGFATLAIYPPIYQLPAVANNGWVNLALQARAKENFLAYVCSFLNNVPAPCT